MDWLNGPMTDGAAGGEGALLLLLILSGVVLMSVFMAINIIAWLSRRSSPTETGRSGTGQNAGSVLVALTALILVVVLFVSGFRPWLGTQVAPAHSVEITAEADSSRWAFTYANGFQSPQLHLPLDQSVVMTLSSRAEIAMLSIPDLGINREAVPGHENSVWFRIPEAGEYPLLPLDRGAAPDTSSGSLVLVHPAGEFATWLTQSVDPLATMTPVKAGEFFVQSLGCAACHSLTGASGVGPSFLGSLGQERTFTSGDRLVVDEAYLVESILNSQARVVEGFQPVMPDFSKQLELREAEAIVEFIKTLAGTDGGH
jgi:cytochrome c oxidase subunit II